MARTRFVIPLSITLLLAAASGVSGQPTPYPKDAEDWPGQGHYRVYPWFKDNRESFWKKREAAQGAVVFIGSSVFANWKGMEKGFPGVKVANRAIGGDTSRGVLFRFEEDVLDLQPKAIVIAAGSNDLSAHAKIPDTLSNLTAMVDMAREKAPDALVVLCTIPPRDNPKAPLRRPGDLAELNQGILELAKSRERVTVLDLNAHFALADGSPDPQYFRDDLQHFNPAGYKRMHEFFKQEFPRLGIAAGPGTQDPG